MLNIETLVGEIRGDLVSQKNDVYVQGISLDTRTLKRGDCYFAIRGARHDGHSYLLEASRKGASAYVIDHVYLSELLENDTDESTQSVRSLPNLIVVQNTVKSLGYLGFFFRNNFQGRAIGITGSCGKTTAKELCAALLAKKYTVLSNRGNYNNHIGVPLTLMGLDNSYDLFLCELGASRKNDIEYLSRLVRPEVGIITNVHPVHLEGFKQIENVYRTKLELAEYLDTVNGTLIIDGDDPTLVARARNFNVNLITFGKRASCDFVLTKSEYEEGKIKFTVNGRYRFTLNTIAHFNVFNALAAVALADYFQLQLPLLQEAMSSFTGLAGRFQIKLKDALIIDDTYNANPFAFAQSLAVLRKIKTKGRKIVVCGDMLEMGPESEQFHRTLGENIVSAGVSLVVALGSETRATIKAIQDNNPQVQCVHFDDNRAAIQYVTNEIQRGDTVLLKGSRGLKLDEIARVL